MHKKCIPFISCTSQQVARTMRRKRSLSLELGRPRRPLTAFNLFVGDFFRGRDVAQVWRGLSVASQEWRTLSEARRRGYKAEAARRKEEYEK